MSNTKEKDAMKRYLTKHEHRMLDENKGERALFTAVVRSIWNCACNGERGAVEMLTNPWRSRWTLADLKFNCGCAGVDYLMVIEAANQQFIKKQKFNLKKLEQEIEKLRGLTDDMLTHALKQLRAAHGLRPRSCKEEPLTPRMML